MCVAERDREYSVREIIVGELKYILNQKSDTHAVSYMSTQVHANTHMCSFYFAG